MSKIMDGLKLLEQLHSKATNITHAFDALSEKDIRKKHLETLTGQIAVSLTNLKINMRFEEKNKDEFLELFNKDPEQAANYIHGLVQNINESIIETVIFQTELIFRFLYSKLKGLNVAEEFFFYRIIAILFADTENNWTKEEPKLVILLWTFRNTIHTGGIYFGDPNGYKLNYKGKEYVFEYGKAPAFQKEGHSLELISDLLDAIKYCFENEPVKSMATFDHPSYHALGY
jgi:hypothetical protein